MRIDSLRTTYLASLSSSLSIFDWSDLLQILRKPEAFSFAVLCIVVFRLFSILGAVGLLRSDILFIFHVVWPWFCCGTVLSVHSLLIATTTRYSGFFLLSFVTRFACDIGQSAKSFIWGHRHLHLAASLLATPCWRDPTRWKQLSTVAILGFQFGLCHVVVPVRFLRSINLALLFSYLWGLSNSFSNIFIDFLQLRSCFIKESVRKNEA